MGNGTPLATASGAFINNVLSKAWLSLHSSTTTHPRTQARLPALHSQQLQSVLEKFAATPKRLGDLQGEYIALVMWHETNAQKDGTIRRDTGFPRMHQS